MLYPPSDLSLFHTTSCSYQCGTQVIIQPPRYEEMSFDWSDFPIVQQEYFVPTTTCAIATTSATFSMPMVVAQDEEIRGEEDDDTMSSIASSFSFSSYGSESTTTTVSKKSGSSKKKVSFSDNLEIRTHSIVLGDHPCCSHLALELGWEYNATELVDIHGWELSKQQQQEKQWMRMATPRRLSYFERRQLLKDVANLSDDDIRQTTLRHARPSTRTLCDIIQTVEGADI